MFELMRVKEVRGRIELPPNPDLLFLSIALCVALRKPALIRPVQASPFVDEIVRSFAQVCDIQFANGAAMVNPKDNGERFAALRYSVLPWPDLVSFLLMSSGVSISFADLPPNRLLTWQKKAHLYGCEISTMTLGDGSNVRTVLSLNVTDAGKLSNGDLVDADNLHAAIAIAVGRKVAINLRTESSVQSPLRNVLNHFGYDLSVKQEATEQKDEDPITKRLRFMQQALTKKKPEGPKQVLTICGNFTNANETEAAQIILPGDDLLGAFFVALKTFVQKGNLVVENFPLESWANAALSQSRKMGSKPAIQPDKTTSFGDRGSVIFQKFEALGRKTECSPLHIFSRQLPALVLMSAFSKGQSVFRGLDDLRNESPDRIELLLASVRKVGGRHGEMPDGMVIDGAKHPDGFDFPEDCGAALNSSCVAAALACSGKSTVADESILYRWPDFKKIMEDLCERK